MIILIRTTLTYISPKMLQMAEKCKEVHFLFNIYFYNPTNAQTKNLKNVLNLSKVLTILMLYKCKQTK